MVKCYHIYKQIHNGSVNIFEELLKNGSVLYTRSRRELEEFAVAEDKEEVRQILTSSTGLIPARVLVANLSN